MEEHAVMRANEALGAPQKAPKAIEGTFRKAGLKVPAEIDTCPGISIFGRTVKSFVFSTDLAIIRNCDADAILAVYPFTPQPAITQALLQYGERPVFVGVAGSVTNGVRSVEIAAYSELQGVSGIVVNATADIETIEGVARAVDVPVVVSVLDASEYSLARIGAGADIVNVAAGPDTPGVLRALRRILPHMPIMATGGPTAATILNTIDAGADAISWTPPSILDLEKDMMQRHRDALTEEECLEEDFGLFD